VLIGDGHGHFTDETATRLQSPPAQAKSWPQRILLQDVNDDGRPDLTIQYAPAGAAPAADPTALYLNDNGVFTPATAPADGFGREGGGIGWVNGDGPHALFSVEFHPLGEAVSHYSVTPELVAPAAPAGVHAKRSGAVVRVSWTRVQGATGYQVRRNGAALATTSGTSYVDRKPGRNPSYTVRAVDAVGSSPDSAAVHP
jgi:hypothetical protein